MAQLPKQGCAHVRCSQTREAPLEPAAALITVPQPPTPPSLYAAAASPPLPRHEKANRFRVQASELLTQAEQLRVKTALAMFMKSKVRPLILPSLIWKQIPFFCKQTVVLGARCWGWALLRGLVGAGLLGAAGCCWVLLGAGCWVLLGAGA
jgi:hypothetical protein